MTSLVSAAQRNYEFYLISAAKASIGRRERKLIEYSLDTLFIFGSESALRKYKPHKGQESLDYILIL